MALGTWKGESLFCSGGDAEAKRPKRQGSTDSFNSWTVSPTELREALGGLGKAAIRFELSEMHDASEVKTPTSTLFLKGVAFSS